MKEYIPKEKIKKQAWKFYFVLAAWPVYIFVLPLVYAQMGVVSILFMIFPGAYLMTWMACLMHECWHKYVPGIPNNTLYNLYSYMLFTDPQIYRLVHGHHHSKVNTWEDIEFHPLGEIKNTYLRRIYNFLEIVLGGILTFGLLMYILPRNELYKGRYKTSSHIISMVMWVLIYGGLGFASATIFNISGEKTAIALLINFWIGNLFVHHSQMIEHGGLIVKGDLNERKLKSRNLKNDGILEKLFLFLTHGENREHVLHHTTPAVYSRPFPGKVPMPQEAVYISLADYAAILWRMAIKGQS